MYFDMNETPYFQSSHQLWSFRTLRATERPGEYVQDRPRSPMYRDEHGAEEPDDDKNNHGSARWHSKCVEGCLVSGMESHSTHKSRTDGLLLEYASDLLK